MSKKRKTKKEKIASQDRAPHLSYSSENSLYSFEQVTTNNQPQKDKETSMSHAYVLQDAKKTLFITTILVFAGFVLFFLIQSNIVKFVYFGY